MQERTNVFGIGTLAYRLTRLDLHPLPGLHWETTLINDNGLNVQTTDMVQQPLLPAGQWPYSESLRDVILRCTRRDPNDRRK